MGCSRQPEGPRRESNPNAADVLSAALRALEHVVGADAPPDDVRLRAPDGGSERERGAAVRREPKLVHAAVAGKWMYERVAGQRRRCLLERGDQLVDGHLEASLLLGRQLAVLALEQRETIKRRHPV